MEEEGAEPSLNQFVGDTRLEGADIAVIVIYFAVVIGFGLWVSKNIRKLTLKVLVRTVDALGHFQSGQLQHSGRGWGMWGWQGTSQHYFPHARP